MCHVFRCDIAARTIANTLRDICKRIMIERSLQQNLAKPIDLSEYLFLIFLNERIDWHWLRQDCGIIWNLSAQNQIKSLLIEDLFLALYFSKEYLDLLIALTVFFKILLLFAASKPLPSWNCLVFWVIFFPLWGEVRIFEQVQFACAHMMRSI